MRCQRAFTFIEVLTTLIIISVVAAFSTPYLVNFFTIQDAKLLQNQLQFVLQTAERTASLTHTPVAVCASVNGRECKGKWHDGQLLFLNPDEDGLIATDAQRLFYFPNTQQRKNSYALNWRAYPIYRHYILFKPDGLAQHDNGTFWLCEHLKPHAAWGLSLNRFGTIRMLQPDAKGKVVDAHGVELKC